MILHLYVVRHGQTYLNKYHRMQGWSDSPLTESGIADARAAGERLKSVQFSAAYCSDTMRAEHTAQIILNTNEESGSVKKPIHSPFFREQFYGYFEGQDMDASWYAAGAPHGAKTHNDIVAKFGTAAAKNFLKQADPFHDAESDDEYWPRVAAGYGLIAQQAREGCDQWGSLHAGDNILQISHGNTLLSLAKRFGDPKLDTSVLPCNGSLSMFDLDVDADFDRCLRIISYNR